MSRESSTFRRPLPAHWHDQACRTTGSILLESSLPSNSDHTSYLFQHPHRTLVVHRPDDLPALFADVESELANGRWVAGWFSYEAGPHFLDLPSSPSSVPLAVLAVYDTPVIFDHLDRSESVHTETPFPLPVPLAIAPMPVLDQPAYIAAVHKIQQWIAAGDTYQVNYTTPLVTPCPHDALTVYQALRRQQPSSFGAILNLQPEHTVLSFSPELFFRVTSAGHIETRPMKGTAPRGNTTEEDHALAQALRADEKNRAEHVMIVDLLRNDLNRICRIGTVRADDLFHIEQYETLHQMTSRVSGTLRQDTSWYEVFRALFPGGSITGAPKRHTAQLIQQIERTPRGVYTGAIGYFAPDRTATFNIAIRTAVLQHAHISRHSERNEAQRSEAEDAACPSRSGTLIIGVGGGIVADSTAASEYNEALLKAAFIHKASEPYQLLETMRAEHGRIPFLDAHLQRLAASAQALGFTCNTEHIRNELATLQPSGRVRLQLHRNGKTDIAVTKAPSWPPELELVLSPQATDATSPHLRHKTTYRPEYGVPTPAGFHDTLFQNTRGELTESSIANLLVQIDGHWYTPPLTSGVLPGVMRAHLISTGQIQERTITFEVLQQQSTAAALCNALRGTAPIASLQLTNSEHIRWTRPSRLPKA